MRHPHEIVPRDDKDEVLVAIFDVLVEIRDALTPAASEPLASEPVEPVAEVAPAVPAAAPREPAELVTQEEASEAASTLATHEHQTAAPRKAPAKRRTTKKRTTKKKAT